MRLTNSITSKHLQLLSFLNYLFQYSLNVYSITNDQFNFIKCIFNFISFQIIDTFYTIVSIEFLFSNSYLIHTVNSNEQNNSDITSIDEPRPKSVERHEKHKNVEKHSKSHHHHKSSVNNASNPPKTIPTTFTTSTLPHGDLLSDVDLDKPIETVIKDLKQEFVALQEEYGSTLNNLRDDVNQSHQIQLLYHQLQRKAMQIHLLRKYKAQIDARLEPPHIPGYEKKIRILKLYRELRHLSDVPATS